LIAGGSLKRTLQNVFTETAKGSKDFAYALDEVRRSARGLLAAKEGAPAATAAMRELAAVLKDPEFVAAADAISSALIRGFVGTVKFVTGVESLREEITQLKKERDGLAAGGNAPRTYIKGEPTFVSRSDQVYGKTRQIEEKERQLREREAAEAKQRSDTWDRAMRGGEVATRRFNTMRELQENIKYLEDLDKEVNDVEFFDQLAREAEVAGARMRESFFDRVAEDAGNVGETLRHTGDSIEEVGEKIGETVNKTAEWSVAADQAARNIQDSFANFLFDPFQDGLRGMLTGFIDVVRRMGAEMAAAKIFGSKSSGGLGVGDLISGIFGGVFAGVGASGGTTSGSAGGDSWSGPRAFGGSVRAGGLYSVNEREMEFLKPDHSGEVIPLSKMGGRGGGSPNVTVNTHVDARHATTDFARVLPAILRQHGEQVKADVIKGLRNGRYQI
jgi:hypothetical protein